MTNACQSPDPHYRATETALAVKNCPGMHYTERKNTRAHVPRNGLEFLLGQVSVTISEVRFPQCFLNTWLPGQAAESPPSYNQFPGRRNAQ